VKLDLKDFTLARLETEFAKLDLPGFRARQIFKWIWQKGIKDWELMTDISKPLRGKLAERYSIGDLKLKARVGSAKEGAVKHLFELEDGARIESVWLKDGNRRTVCCSTQVGCSLGCEFCRTAKMGFLRNLTPGEIAGQVLNIAKGQTERITNVVFMGMGEPFLNYEASLDAARILNHDLGSNIGARKITLSTVGIVPGISEFAQEPEQFKLAVSLNAADQETRERIMPIARRYPLKELIPAVVEYIEIKGKRVTFEYVLLKNINERRKDADNLIMLLAGISCKINLIPFNPYPESRFQAPSEEEAARFREWLMPDLPAVSVRKSLGSAILAGCGQLAIPQQNATHSAGDPE
jgi:23S rRNA (adenine2503-C2)-methyltransferase